MVMDLNLPDLSGYELLTRMAEADEPPSLRSSSTGRTLTGEEEQGLRRFSKSIIIKGCALPGAAAG